MDKKEFDAWTAETKFSERCWRRDYITGENSKLRARRMGDPSMEEELFYKGGEDGVYIEIRGNGTVTVGEYEGAIPHIGEAIFKVKHSNRPLYNGKPAETLSDGFTAITERLGLQFLVELLSAA